jgi:hypothetical protein
MSAEKTGANHSEFRVGDVDSISGAESEDRETIGAYSRDSGRN